MDNRAAVKEAMLEKKGDQTLDSYLELIERAVNDRADQALGNLVHSLSDKEYLSNLDPASAKKIEKFQTELSDALADILLYVGRIKNLSK